MSQKSILFVLLALILAAGAYLALYDGGGGPGPFEPGTGQATNPGEGPGGADTQQGKAVEERRKEESRALVEGQQVPVADGGPVLRGRLVFTGGAPASGQTVEFRAGRFVNGFGGRRLAPPGRSAEAAKKPPRQASTDAQGRFTLRLPPATKGGHLCVAGDDLVLAAAKGAVGMVVDGLQADRDLGDLEVLQAASISGQVVAGGRGVEGVEIALGSVAPAFAFFGGRTVTKSDAQGRFILKRLKPGKIQLSTSSPDYLPASEAVELAEGQQVVDLLVELRRGRVLTGTVVDDLGQPIEGATVSAARARKLDAGMSIRGFNPSESTTSDASGQFRLAGLDEAVVELRSTKKGHAPGKLAKVAVEQTEVVLRMPRNGSISGILVDAKGEPIAGSRVRANPADGMSYMMNTMQLGRTDDAGKFVLSSTAPGSNTVVASGDDHLDVEENVEVRPGEKTEGVRLVARRGSTVTVTVVDTRGMPVAGAKVSVATVGEADAFRNLRFDRPGTRVRRAVRRSVASGRDGVRILSGDGEPIGSAVTDEQGVAVIKGVPKGLVDVKAKHEELALLDPARVEVPENGEATAKLSMLRGGFVEARVVDPAGKPMDAARFAVIGPLAGDAENVPRESHSANVSGEAVVGPLRPGAYRAVLEHDSSLRSAGGAVRIAMLGNQRDYADSTVPFAIKAGEATAIELHMPVLTTVTGTVSDAKGLVRGAEVELLRDGEIRMPMMGRHKTKTDAAGRFAIEGLPSGEYTLYWNRHGAHIPNEKQVVLQKNQAALEEQLVLAGAIVSLQVRDEDEGFGVEEAKISLRRFTPPDPATPNRRVVRQARIMMVGMTAGGGAAGPSTFSMSSGSDAIETDETGRAVIKDVPPGKYTLTIKHRDYAQISKVVDVVGDQDKNLGVIPVFPGCKVRGRLDLAASGPIDMVMVEIRGAAGNFTDTEISRDGSFRFEGLRAGKYKLRARAVQGVDWGPAKSVELHPERPARVTLAVPKPK